MLSQLRRVNDKSIIKLGARDKMEASQKGRLDVNINIWAGRRTLMSISDLLQDLIGYV